MNIETSAGIALDEHLLKNYLSSLVDKIFKILPLKENDDDSFTLYVCGLRNEMLGCHSLINVLHSDSRFLTIIAMLEYMVAEPERDTKEVRREVFKAITLCQKLKDCYFPHSEESGHE